MDFTSQVIGKVDQISELERNCSLVVLAFNGGYSRAKNKFCALGFRRLEQGIGYLAIPQSRIIKFSRSRRLKPRYGGRHFADHAQQGVCGNPPPGLRYGKLLGRKSPQFARVREVKVAADRASQSALQNAGESLGSAILNRKEFLQRIKTNSQCESLRKMSHQIQRSQWEMDPAPSQTNAAMAGPKQQVFAEQSLQIAQDFWVACWMKPVTAVIHMYAFEFKAAGITAGFLPLLENCGMSQALPAQLERRAQASRTGA